MTISLITFDLDNTLWDSEPALIRADQAQREWLLQHRPGTIEHHDQSSLWEFKKDLWKRHPQLSHHVSQLRIQTLYELQRVAGYSEEEAQRGAEQAFKVFLEQRQAVELYPEALEVLAVLASRYRLGALTNGNADIYKTEAARFFDFAFLAEDVGASKPAPDMFLAALKHCDLKANNTIHIGDSPEHDIQGAQAVGMYTVWMNPAQQAWPGGESPHRVITNLRELPEAIASIAAS
ncbi:HAD family hydrolase [Parahaliea sp. F7430]|uniref:HAD family hydrolase n=1 Tax=Sediminihaliea albiluteola TaxID=2758564 RepID=A0A7W2TWK5_9GAMM|nr:HAD family hydrolase [Sediminihaliea albiluteola]MBA6413292.1 HAD family hydrolase [Sediminihaliea albiluteola]